MQALELPSSVHVGPFTYAVNAEGSMLKSNEWGLCRPSTFEILVDRHAPPMRVADTYLHEVFHALWNTMRIGDNVSEEHAVGLLATAFLGFMRDNPDGLDVVWEAIAQTRQQTLNGSRFS